MHGSHGTKIPAPDVSLRKPVNCSAMGLGRVGAGPGTDAGGNKETTGKNQDTQRQFRAGDSPPDEMKGRVSMYSVGMIDRDYGYDIGSECHELEMNAAFRQWEEENDTEREDNMRGEAAIPLKMAIDFLLKAAEYAEEAAGCVAGLPEEDRIESYVDVPPFQ